MADVKISGLPASTTPLAGTEVLPVVQSGVTKQVSVANLTAGRAISASSATVTGNLTFTGTGNRITGDFSNATAASRVAFQTSTTNGNTNITLIPNGTSTTSSVNLHANSDIDNASRGRLTANSLGVQLFAEITGTGTFLPIIMHTGGSERLRITTTGDVGIGTSSPATKLDVAGSIKTLGYTVATLPTGVAGMKAYVTDASVPVFLNAVVGGGAVVTPVFHNGTTWVAG
jgi:hypothetical protein